MNMHCKVIPVIHYQSDEQAMRNAERAVDAGCDGVFLIHMDGENELLAPIACSIKSRWTDRILVGINYLGVDPAKAALANIANGLDMTWTDVQLTHSSAEPWTCAEMIQTALAKTPKHLLFAGVAFKHQRPEPNPELAARMADKFGFVATTSGSATGVAAEVDKIARLRAALGDAPLAIASGVTPDNVHEYAPHLSHILVATGVSETFHEFDYEKLYRLRSLCQ
jgi:predicted TIM-barrel enzyme